jgi:hypothetical protein
MPTLPKQLARRARLRSRLIPQLQVRSRGTEPRKGVAVISKQQEQKAMENALVRQPSFAEILRRALHDHYDAVLVEPIPQRCVDLMKQLCEGEAQTDASRVGPQASGCAPKESSRATRNSHD